MLSVCLLFEHVPCGCDRVFIFHLAPVKLSIMLGHGKGMKPVKKINVRTSDLSVHPSVLPQHCEDVSA